PTKTPQKHKRKLAEVIADTSLESVKWTPELQSSIYLLLLISRIPTHYSAYISQRKTSN
ncbi:hypothetical protein AJ80_10092, partial [Polytolypa hystricis UAMH7299]